MVKIGDVIFAIVNRPSITSIIGTNPVRLFPNVLPQKEDSDSLVYRINTNLANATFSGASTLDHVMVDFFAYCRSKANAEALTEILRSEIDRTSGTFADVDVQMITYQDSGSDDWLDDIQFFTKQIEFKITYRR